MVARRVGAASHDYDEDRLEWLLVKCQEVKRLSAFEQSFINGIIDNRTKYGSKACVSERMMDQLEKIAARADK